MYSFKVFHLVVRRNNKNVFPRAYLKAKIVGYRDHGGMSFNKPFNLDDTKQFQYSTVINILNLTVKLESCFHRLWWMKEWEKGWGRESERGFVSVYVRIVFFMFFITVSYRPCICFLCFQTSFTYQLNRKFGHLQFIFNAMLQLLSNLYIVFTA